MNRATLDRLLSLGEGQDIEFKARPEARVIGPQVCAFINSWGGYVVVGVADSGEVSGVPIGSDLAQLEQGIASGLAPRAMVTFEEHDLDGKTVWVIEVPRGQDVPYDFRDEVYVREGASTRRAAVSTLRDMVMRRQIEPERWERRLSVADPDEDLDPDEVAAAMRDDIQRAGPLAEGTRGPVEVLERLGLVSHGRLTNAGDVLFARHPATRHPQVRVQAVCYTGDKTDDAYRDLKMLEGPLVPVLSQTYAFIQRNTASRIQLVIRSMDDTPLCQIGRQRAQRAAARGQVVSIHARPIGRAMLRMLAPAIRCPRNRGRVRRQ